MPKDIDLMEEVRFSPLTSEKSRMKRPNSNGSCDETSTLHRGKDRPNKSANEDEEPNKEDVGQLYKLVDGIVNEQSQFSPSLAQAKVMKRLEELG
jgi:hypothetical protein